MARSPNFSSAFQPQLHIIVIGPFDQRKPISEPSTRRGASGGLKTNRLLQLLAGCLVLMGSWSHGKAQDHSLQARLTGKWIQHYTGMS